MKNSISKYLMTASAMSILLTANMLGAQELPHDAIVSEHSTEVSYRDLDLTRQADVATLYERIKAAATISCRKAEPRHSRQRPNAMNSCVDAAVERSVVDFDQPMLTAVHRDTSSALASR